LWRSSRPLIAGRAICDRFISPPYFEKGQRKEVLEILHMFRECAINFGVFSSNAGKYLSHTYKMNRAFYLDRGSN